MKVWFMWERGMFPLSVGNGADVKERGRMGFFSIGTRVFIINLFINKNNGAALAWRNQRQHQQHTRCLAPKRNRRIENKSWKRSWNANISCRRQQKEKEKQHQMKMKQ